MPLSDNITRAVDDEVRRRLPGVPIDRIEVTADRDQDDDEALFVTIVLERDPERLDPKALLGLIRHIREKLSSVNEDRFPYTRFMTRAEYDEAAA